MTVQLFIYCADVIGKHENGALKLRHFTKRSAPMSIQDLTAKYGAWMSTHTNWCIKPIDIPSDF